MSNKTLYQILQVDSEASLEVISAAYRRLARLYHPDLSDSPDAMERMQEINKAYEILRDSEKRRQYDAYLKQSHSRLPGSQSRGTTPGSGNPFWKRRPDPTGIPPDFPRNCQKCGKSDASLRIAAFPYVVSILILTFRRNWAGLYCADCRRKEMSQAKLISLVCGWWGIPFGVFYTLGVLLKSSEGEVPAEINAPYLRALGAYFLQVRRLVDAEQAMLASLEYEYNTEYAQLYREIFKREPTPESKRQYRSEYQTTGEQKSEPTSYRSLLWVLAILLIIFFSLPTILGRMFTPSAPTPVPTREGGILVEVSTPTPTSLPPATNLISTPESLRTIAPPITPQPTESVVAESFNYQWVTYVNPRVSLLYPNGWWVQPRSQHIFISSEDNFLSVQWHGSEFDLDWLFRRLDEDSEVASDFHDMILELEEIYIEGLQESIEAPIEIKRFEQTQLGEFLTLGGIVYEVEVEKDWADANRLTWGLGIVKCGSARVCYIEYNKIDEQFTEEDWRVLDLFARHIVFHEEEATIESSIPNEKLMILSGNRKTEDSFTSNGSSSIFAHIVFLYHPTRYKNIFGIEINILCRPL